MSTADRRERLEGLRELIDEASYEINAVMNSGTSEWRALSALHSVVSAMLALMESDARDKEG